MPSKMEKKQTAADLSNLLKHLNNAGIEFILVGGLAAVAQGAPISTFDMDIVHRQTDDNIRKLHLLLKSIGATQRRPDDKILKPTEEDLKEKEHILLNTRLGPLDVLAYIEKGLGFDELIKDTVEIRFEGYKVYVLSLETIVKLKRDSKDPKNSYRMPILEETLRQISKGKQNKK